MDGRISAYLNGQLSDFPVIFGEDENELSWLRRSEYWLAELSRRKINYRQKRQEHLPLILAGHGVRLTIENAALVVRHGLTHHPQKPEKKRYFRGDRFLPSRIIMLDGDGYLTFDVLAWLSEQKIPLVQLDWMGSVTCVIGGSGYGADLKLQAAQLATKKTSKQLRIARWLVEQKLRATCETLKTALPASDATARAMEFSLGAIKQLKSCPPNSISKLNGIEGRAAYLYFRAWREIPLSWKGTGRKPIPTDWLKFTARNSLDEINRNAVHPVNAMLNYAYAVCENLVRIQIVAEGFDPTIAFMHGNWRKETPLALDVMEPLRPVVDAAILEFVQAHKFEPGDFAIDQRGVCRLNRQMGRVVVKTVDLGSKVANTVSHLRKLVVGTGR